MIKELKQTKDSFYEIINDSKKAEKFIDLINARIETDIKKMNLFLWSLLLCIILFFLSDSGKIDELTFSYFKITDSKLIMLILPTIFSYSYLNFLARYFDYTQKTFLLELSVSKFFPSNNNKLKNYLSPFSFFGNVSHFLTNIRFKYKFFNKIYFFFFIFVMIILGLSPLILNIYFVTRIIFVFGFSLKFILFFIIPIFFIIISLIYSFSITSKKYEKDFYL